MVAALLLAVAARDAQAGQKRQRPAQRSTVTATAAILIDNQTGQVLWERNPDLRLPPASTTKVMTALLALQSGRLDESLRVSPRATQAQPSKIYLRSGWTVRLRDLVYAVLLKSANDASEVVAEGLAGSVPRFAEHMNAHARLLGATNTNFVNPHGLPAANHYSTVRDLATIFGHAMRNPMFDRAVSTRTASLKPTSGSTRTIALHTHNRLLGNYRIHVVGKTGWTIAAKKCFVGAARADGRELLVAVLGSTDLWGDLKHLIEFGFRGADPPIPGADALQATAPKATPVPRAIGDDDDDPPSRRYAVQLATFREFDAASRLKRTFEAKGYRVRIAKLQEGRRALFRVSVGMYPSRGAAQQIADKIKKTHGHLKPFVREIA